MMKPHHATGNRNGAKPAHLRTTEARITLTLTAGQDTWVRAQADQHGKAINAVVRDCIDKARAES